MSQVQSEPPSPSLHKESQISEIMRKIMKIASKSLGSKSLPEPSSVVVVGLAVVVGFLVVVLVVVAVVVVEVVGLVVVVLEVVVVAFGVIVGFIAFESWLPGTAGGWVSQVQSDPASPCLHKSSHISAIIYKTFMQHVQRHGQQLLA